MSLFKYTAVDKDGKSKSGVVEAVSKDVAISALQRRGLIVSSISDAEQSDSLLEIQLDIFNRIKPKDIVILSQQITTLFEAQVSALRVFRMLAAETENPALKKILFEISTDIQSGSTISSALAKHPKVFSDFYVNMVKAGEETGRLDEAFTFLADYIDRTYEVSSKARNALIYPAFVIATFIGVMVLMLTSVIPKLTQILEDSGTEIPTYTKVVMVLSEFLSKNIIFIGIGLLVSAYFAYKYVKTPEGSRYVSELKMKIPYVGDLYRKLYMSRIADSLSTTLSSGIQLVRGTEIAASVVGDPNYAKTLKDVSKDIQTGKSMSESLRAYNMFPGIFVAMVKVGEESGNLAEILKTLAKFYRREVQNAVDTLVSLIEPIMIVLLGLGVGILLASVMIPIYNISAGI